jgi:hypothetical protein
VDVDRDAQRLQRQLVGDRVDLDGAGQHAVEVEHDGIDRALGHGPGYRCAVRALPPERKPRTGSLEPDQIAVDRARSS